MVLVERVIHLVIPQIVMHTSITCGAGNGIEMSVDKGDQVVKRGPHVTETLGKSCEQVLPSMEVLNEGLVMVEYVPQPKVVDVRACCV